MTATKNPHEGGHKSFSPRHSTTPPSEPPDFQQAAHFLTLLDESAERWTFQTFDDNKDRKNPDLTRILHGTLEEHWEELCRLSALGAGVFMVVNETNGKGRKTADIIRVRTVFRELDRAGARPLPPGIEPHLVVESSPGKFHEYLLLDGGHHFDRFEGVMQRLVDDYDSDPAAKDRSRVLRLPGFPHQKNPATPWRVRLYAEGGHQPYTWDQVTAALPPKKRARTTSKIPPGKGLEDLDLIRSALATIPPDCEYQPWLTVGMALHYASGGGVKGFTLWDEWSAQGDSYRDGMTRYKWGTFGHYTGSPATLGTLFHLAQEYGWKRSRGNGHDDKPPRDYGDYPEAHGYEKDKAAGAGAPPPPELPKLLRITISIDDLTIEPSEPPFLIGWYMPKDVQALIGTGGTGKSTLDMLQDIHLILGRPLWEMPVLDPGPVVYVTAEDGEDRLKWRLFHIVNQLGLTRSERQKVADNFHIVNLVGAGRKLVAQDRDGNLVITSLADQIIEEFLPIAPVRVSFDPMVKFGPGERAVNDGEDMLVNAGLRITRNLHCATNFTHHVSKEVARNGIVDHHSGRGGSALGDGVRAAYQLLTITTDLAKNKNYPGVGIYHADVADGRLLALHITKLTDAKRPLEPLILRRNGWLFEPVEMPSQADLESAIHAARQERANSDVKALIAYLKERPFLKPSRNDLENLYEDIGLTRNKVRAAITKGLKVDLTLIEVSLPSAEQKGGKQTYIAVAGGDQ